MDRDRPDDDEWGDLVVIFLLNAVVTRCASCLASLCQPAGVDNNARLPWRAHTSSTSHARSRQNRAEGHSLHTGRQSSTQSRRDVRGDAAQKAPAEQGASSQSSTHFLAAVSHAKLPSHAGEHLVSTQRASPRASGRQLWPAAALQGGLQAACTQRRTRSWPSRDAWHSEPALHPGVLPSKHRSRRHTPWAPLRSHQVAKARPSHSLPPAVQAREHFPMSGSQKRPAPVQAVSQNSLTRMHCEGGEDGRKKRVRYGRQHRLCQMHAHGR